MLDTTPKYEPLSYIYIAMAVFVAEVVSMLLLLVSALACLGFALF